MANDLTKAEIQFAALSNIIPLADNNLLIFPNMQWYYWDRTKRQISIRFYVQRGLQRDKR